MSYIGLDIGTSSCKAAIITEEGKITRIASANYAFESPKQGYVELNPLTIWRNIIRILREISPFANDVKMLALSSIGESMVITDKNNTPLYNGIVYLDNRCQKISAEIQNRIDTEHLHDITGVPCNPMFSLNKIIWLRQNCPEVLDKSDKIFLFGDYFSYRLCGERAVDEGTASRTMFFDCRKHCWSKEIIDLFDIPIDKLSPVRPSGQLLGTIRPAVAKETNLPKTLKIINGIHDQCSATLGSGALKPGDIMIGQGTAESINCVCHKNQLTQALIDYQISFEPYLDEEHYLVITGNLTHGSSIRWFMDTVYSANGHAQSTDYENANKTCPSSSGDLFFIPYLSQTSLMDASNVALGGFLGVDVTVSKNQMYRAILEGLSYECRKNIDLLSKLDISINHICATGGSSGNPLYMQMKSDIINRPIQLLQNQQAGILGLGILCAVANHDYLNMEEAVQAFSHIDKVYRPRKDYSARYETYLKITDAVKSLYHSL